MRKILLLTLCLFLIIQSASSQTTYGVTSSFNNGNPNGITFNESTTTGWTLITGLAGSLATNVWSDAISLPFAFNFFNTPVTQFKVSANGLLTFDASVTGTPPNGNVSLPDASLPNNTIAAFSDEFTNTQPTGSNDLVYHQTIGTAPNRHFVVYWFSFEYGNPSTSFQYNAIVFEETTNKIHIMDTYGTGTPGFTTTVGLQKDASTSVQFGSSVPLAGSVNGTTAADNDYYTFTPGNPCNGVPVVGATVASNNTPCAGSSITLSLGGYISEPSHSFQWESSNDNSNWNPVSGATQATYNVTITTPTYFRCIVTCTNTSQSTSSTSILISNYIAPNPYSQNFATYPATSGSQVDCWSEAAGRIPASGNTVFSSTTTSNWLADGFANNGTTGAARVNITGTTTDEWIISPSFNLNGNQQLEFDIAMTGSGVTTASALGTDDSLCVVISTDNGVTWESANILRTWKSGDAISNTGEHVTISLSSYNGLVKIGIYAASTITNATPDVFIDNFVVSEVCNGAPVVGATVASSTSVCPAALFTLSLGGYTVASGHTYQWESSPDNSTWTPISGATQVTYATNIYQNTYYRCVVTCTNGGANSTSTPIQITTQSVTLPYTQNFTTYPATSGSQVDCWYEAAGAIPASGNAVLTSITTSNWLADGFANNGTTGAARVNITSTTTDEWIISPSFNLTGNEQLDFDIAMTGSGVTTASALGADDSLCVVISTDNGATWTAANILRTWKSGDAISNTGEHITISLTSYTGVVKIGIYAASTISNATPDVFIDNFLVQPVPSCFQPNNLSVSAITQTGSTLNWIAPTTAPTSYDWIIVAAGAGSGGTPVASGNVLHPTVTANATGLTGSTNYDAWVRSNCSGSGNSVWTGPTAFRTLPANDEPAGAYNITLATPMTINTEGATQTLAACVGTADDDVWFTFTPPSSGTYTFAFAGLTGTTDQAYQIFDGNPSTTGISMGCFDGPAAGGNFDNLDAAKTYYIRVYSFTSTTTTRITGGTITINSYTGTTPPTNNDCSGATAITVSNNGACTYTSLTSVNATYSLAPSICITSFNPPANDDDIWVSFTTTSLGTYALKSTSASSFGIQLFTGSCGTLTSVGCNVGFVGTTGYTATLNASTTYYARIWTSGSTTAGLAFDLCIEAPLPNTVFTGTGNWSDAARWSSGVPSCATNNIDAIIASGANCTLDITGATAKNLTIQSTASFTVNNANDLTVGCTGNNAPFILDGTLTVANTGILRINGTLRGVAASSQLIQSGGEIIVDGNDNGNLATSAPSHIFDFVATTASNLQLTGGKITIVDPSPLTTTTVRAFKLYPSVHIDIPNTHTVQFGDGISNTSGGYTTGGIAVELYNSAALRYVTLGNVIMNSSSATALNRHVYTFNTIGINGNLTITDGDYRMATTHYIAGNIINNDSLTVASVLRLEAFTGGTATAVTTPQTITGSGVWRNSTGTTPSATMTSLTVNNTSGTPIVLPPSMLTGVGTGSISSTLTLTAGILDCGTTPFTLGTTATSGGTFSTTPVASSYIIGEFRRWVTTTAATRYFPIGTTTTPRFGQINFTTAQTTGGLISMKFNNNEALPPVGTGGIPAEAGNNNIPIDIVSPTGSWTVERISGAGGVYNAIFDATGFLRNDMTPINVPDYPQLALIKRTTNGAWVAGADGVAQPITNLNTIARNGCTAFSVFALGGTHQSLPVTISSIRGEVTGTTNTIYWTTATEQNNAKFVVERSADGINFASLGEVVSRAFNGNSSTPISYNFVDANPVQGKQYYRLQMIDRGGRAIQSQIVTLRRGGGKIEIVDVRPNPTTSTVYFNVLGTNANVNVAVRDLSGKEVIRKGLVQSNSFSLDLSQLVNGMYILEAIDIRNGEKAIFKIMKQ